MSKDHEMEAVDGSLNMLKRGQRQLRLYCKIQVLWKDRVFAIGLMHIGLEDAAMTYVQT
jgi:hypothetical protein